MFKVIESDEEFESARAAGLLWVNCSSLFPRPVNGWRQVAWGRTVTEHYWRNKTNDPANYMPEDFAVLVEEEDE